MSLYILRNIFIFCKILIFSKFPNQVVRKSIKKKNLLWKTHLMYLHLGAQFWGSLQDKCASLCSLSGDSCLRVNALRVTFC